MMRLPSAGGRFRSVGHWDALAGDQVAAQRPPTDGNGLCLPPRRRGAGLNGLNRLAASCVSSMEPRQSPANRLAAVVAVVLKGSGSDIPFQQAVDGRRLQLGRLGQPFGSPAGRRCQQDFLSQGGGRYDHLADDRGFADARAAGDDAQGVCKSPLNSLLLGGVEAEKEIAESVAGHWPGLRPMPEQGIDLASQVYFGLTEPPRVEHDHWLRR